MEEEKKMTALNPAVGAAGKRSFIDKNVNDILPEGSTEFNIFREIRSKVSAREAAEYYGLKVGRNGMACCPFHPDRHPSLKLDGRFHCFGCGADGDVIDYVSRLTGLTLYESALKLCHDFGIMVSQTSSVSSRKARSGVRRCPAGKRQEKTRIQEKFRRWRDWAIDVLKEYTGNMELWKEQYAPTDPYAEWNPLFVEALQNFDRVSYYLDVLCLEREEDQIAFFIDMREEVRRIDKRNKEPGEQYGNRRTA